MPAGQKSVTRKETGMVTRKKGLSTGLEARRSADSFLWPPDQRENGSMTHSGRIDAALEELQFVVSKTLGLDTLKRA